MKEVEAKIFSKNIKFVDICHLLDARTEFFSKQLFHKFVEKKKLIQ